MTTDHTRTQERIEQAVAAHLDSCTPERYAYIMKHLGPWTDGFLARDAEPTTVNAESLEGEFEDIDYEAVDRVAAKHGLTRHQAFAGAQALHSYEESKRGISGQIVRGVEARHVEAAIKVIASVKNLGGPS